MTREQLEQIAEIRRCADGVEGCIHYIRTHCMIEDPQRAGEKWFRFDLWPEQEQVIRELFENQRTIALKARQLGLTWLAVAVGLWYMTFRPGSKVGLFSARDKEAVVLLKERMKGMHKRLPDFLRPAVGEVNNDHEWRLQNESVAFAFPTGRGDSYTLTLAIIDEADLPDNLDKTLMAVEPTIDAGGKLFLLSKVDKSKPGSLFKKIYRAARAGENRWTPVFLPWSVRPERTQQWYEEQKRDSLANTGSLDKVHENYPATEAEALAPKSLDKRIPSSWLDQCYTSMEPVTEHQLQECLATRNAGKQEGDEGYLAFTVRGLTIYKLPEEGRFYVIGADPAEGNPASDGSALSVMDRETWEEVAVLDEKLEPEDFARTIDQIGMLYNKASAMIERNNHGHAVLLAMRGFSKLHRFVSDDKKPGWLQTQKAKTLIYDTIALAFRQGDVEIHNLGTYTQLAAISGSTLNAPEGEHDDRAMAFGLALMGAKRPRPQFV